ncbi:MG2 domain-containing protein [Hymenobacter radiodurans]|uniref:MG2 domain-containing protein n=1 Tax=Hymenobacter radiodurans TaxID=2496028 RepID=UPI0014047758|nr:MG2 domain-containing protein [Hymenobacter radiodurans]
MRLFGLLFLLVLVMISPTSTSAPDPKKWRQIDALLAKDQTASAAKLVDEIYRQARQRQDTPEYLRAVLYKLRLLEEKEEDAQEKAIALVEADLKTAKFPARPILHSLLAQLYARYYDEHRYQLYDRTTQASPDSVDIRTWDAARLGSAVVRHYRASVADEPQRLQQMTLKELGYAVRLGDAEGQALRPTLYDLLAHRAVSGLENDEFYITTPAQQFELQDKTLFGPATEFANLKLSAPAADSLNGQFHALQILQQLTAFRLQANNPAALADVELERLRFVHEHTELNTNDELYQAALARSAESFKALPISTRFLAEQAESLEESEPVKARAIALEAEKRFPKSLGGQKALALRRKIEAVEVAFTTEEVLLPNQAWLLKLDVRNAPKLYAKAYRMSTALASRMQEQPELFRNQEWRKIHARALNGAPVGAWTLALPGPTDYKSHSIQNAGPALPLGRYLIVVSTAADNPTQKRAGVTTVFAELSVSELGQLRRRDSDQEGAELLVLHRQSGQALAGVQVVPFFQYYDQASRDYKRRRGDALTTSAEGLTRIALGLKTGDNTQLGGILLTKGRDSLLVTEGGYYFPRRSRNPEPEQAERQAFLYTDRAIYRPGQTLYFKGIVTESLAGKSRLLTKEAVSVRLQDVNGQTVQTLPFTTSAFGSFHGSIVLPTGLLNGEMSLQTDYGSVSFAVEDYKRPTFQVTFEPVQGTPVLGQEITMRGKATAYAGQPIDGAAVSYRVTRRTLWPMFGRGIGGGRPEMEILSGTTQTDSVGAFW